MNKSVSYAHILALLERGAELTCPTIRDIVARETGRSYTEGWARRMIYTAHERGHVDIWYYGRPYLLTTTITRKGRRWVQRAMHQAQKLADVGGRLA